MSGSSCPICESRNPRKNLAKVSFTFDSEFDLAECLNCGVIFHDPVIELEQLVTFYSPGGYDFNRWRQESKADMYIKKLNRIKHQGKFLDVGCASAYFINRIGQCSDWEVYGVEISKKPAEFAKNELGLKNITHGDLLSAGYPDGFFDYINISDVLEHVTDPVSILSECRRIIKPEGIVFLAVPNGHNDSRGLINYYKRYNEAGCHASGHIFFFPIRALHFLFGKTQFRIIKGSTSAIKHGLRSLGRIPRKTGWGNFYKPRTAPEVSSKDEIKLVVEKERSDLYYKYRYLKHNWANIPGLNNFGLDFKIELSPILKNV